MNEEQEKVMNSQRRYTVPLLILMATELRLDERIISAVKPSPWITFILSIKNLESVWN